MNRRTTLALPTVALLCMAAIGRPALGQQQQRVIVQTNYWALPGKAEEVYEWRMHASDVTEKLGLLRGRVLRRQGNSEVLPDVMWQIEFPNDAERIRYAQAVTTAPEFQEVQKHMETLVHRFELSIWLAE
jgi:hypothetical protein